MATNIEWTDETWNPTRGCSRVSPGCVNCYAERVVIRFAAPGIGVLGEVGRIPSERPAAYKAGPFYGFVQITNGHPSWTGKVELVESALDKPLHWRTPKRIFVNSMSDLFHEELSNEDIDRVFAVMLACYVLENKAGHTFQILTKRHERLLRYMTERTPEELIKAWSYAADGIITLDNENVFFHEMMQGHTSHDWDSEGTNSNGSEYKPWGYLGKVWPLPNVVLGVSVEDRPRKNRLDSLRLVPAVTRFVSFEPLLEDLGELDLTGISWAIWGGESGPGARPLNIEWIRNGMAQADKYGTKNFVKQVGAHVIQDGERRRKKDKKGGDVNEWPHDIRVRQFPEVPCNR